jgi:hypothetical protein
MYKLIKIIFKKFHLNKKHLNVIEKHLYMTSLKEQEN